MASLVYSDLQVVIYNRPAYFVGILGIYIRSYSSASLFPEPS